MFYDCAEAGMAQNVKRLWVEQVECVINQIYL